MPYQWIDPKLFLEYAGVAVYHCYTEDNQVSAYWYTTDVADCDLDEWGSHEAPFDVRDLPSLGLDVEDRDTHAAVIRHAIGAGLITGEPAVTSDQRPFSQIFGQAVDTLFTQPSIINSFKNTEIEEEEMGKFLHERKRNLFLALIETARLEMLRFLVDLNEVKGIRLETLSDLPAPADQAEARPTLPSFPQRSPVSNRVKIEVWRGIVSVVEKPPGVEVAIIDRDIDRQDEGLPGQEAATTQPPTPVQVSERIGFIVTELNGLVSLIVNEEVTTADFDQALLTDLLTKLEQVEQAVNDLTDLFWRNA